MKKMNKQELNRALSHIHASADLKREVLTMKSNPNPNFRLIAKRAAVCAAALALLIGTVFFWPASEENYVTAPGLITVRAHEVDDTGNATIESVALNEGVVFTPEYVYRTDASYREEFPFFFQIEHELYSPEEFMLEVSTNSGIFYKHSPGDLSMIGKSPVEQLLYHNFGQHFTVNADEALYWKPDGFDYAYMKEQFENGNTDVMQVYKEFGFNSSPSYFDIIIRAGENIVGYCVIEVHRSETDISPYAHRFSFEAVAVVGFPMVDGKYQKVSYNYVQTQIEKIHCQ
jgi:hypothetical protein